MNTAFILERKEFMQDREEKTEQQLQETIKAADEQPILISDACKQLSCASILGGGAWSSYHEK